jgi:chorismate dehydratase
VCYIEVSRESAAILPKLRIAIVEFLNAAPLAWGLTEGPLAGRYKLLFATPSQCAEALRRGQTDVAIIPAIEYQRLDDLAVVPGVAVAAKREVRSILVVAKKPIQRVRRMALDSSSRSSAALVQLLCPGRWRIQPEFEEADPDPAAMLASADAALVIGDAALRIAVKMDALAIRQPSGEQCCQGDPEDMPVPGYDSLYVYDVAHEWREMTGLPCVLALWAGRREALTPAVVADFQASCEYGIMRIPEICEAASLKLDLPAAALEQYLRENLDHSLNAENLAGLEHYYRECAAAGLIPSARPLEFAAATSPAMAARD